MSSVRKQLEEKEKKLIELRLQLETIEANIESKSSQIPKALSEVIAIESENKSIVKQIEIFEEKVSQLKQKTVNIFKIAINY